MITFKNRGRTDAHNKFQSWRRENPDGFLLNVEPTKKFKLHHVDCWHLGDNVWEPADFDASLTKTPKACSVNRDELLEWAAAQGATVSECAHCIKRK